MIRGNREWTISFLEQLLIAFYGAEVLVADACRRISCNLPSGKAQVAVETLLKPVLLLLKFLSIAFY